METLKIIDEIRNHLMFDVNYKMFGVTDPDGRVGLGYNVTFDISNSPKEFFAPYFKIESANDAKLIFKDVFREMPLQELDGFFERVLRTKNIDFTKELFLCIYKPDRL